MRVGAQELTGVARATQRRVVDTRFFLSPTTSFTFLSSPASVKVCANGCKENQLVVRNKWILLMIERAHEFASSIRFRERATHNDAAVNS